jgi:hypothetical protein
MKLICLLSLICAFNLKAQNESHSVDHRSNHLNATVGAKLSSNYKLMLSNTKWYTHSKTIEGAINSVFESFKDTFVLGKKYTMIKETFVNLPGIFTNPFQGTGVSPY